MKTLIVYNSRHHGNTEKLVRALAEAHDDIDTVHVSELGKALKVDVSGYPLVIFASGVYYGKFDHKVRLVAEHSVKPGSTVVGLMTYGGADRWLGKDLNGICQLKFVTYMGAYGCVGWDTWGPFRFIGGVNKGRPNAEDIEGCCTWYDRLLDEYGDIIQEAYDREQARLAWDKAHPDPTLMDKLRNTAAHMSGRKRKEAKK